MTSCWSILIGARRIGSRHTFSRADEKRLQEITTKHFAAGYTILEARGGWFDPSMRKFIREDSRQILITSNSMRAVRAWAKALGAALSQKELLLIKAGDVRRVRISRRRA